MILNEILNFGISKKYFKILPIKDIEKSCCDLEFRIIDFDESKDLICKASEQTTRKSCDGLYLHKSIDFIEFKSINNFFSKEFKYRLKANKTNISESQIIKEKVSKFNFNKKIRDSVWIWDYIINHHEIKLKNDVLESVYKIEKNYFIVKDNSQPLINLAIQFNTLGQIQNNKLSNHETMDILINESLDKITIINKPQLIDCKQLKKYLEETT